MDWHGEERRNPDNDHDVLTRIDANLSNFMRQFDAHAKEDLEYFHKLNARIEKAEKFIYIALGGIAVLEFVLKVMLK